MKGSSVLVFVLILVFFSALWFVLDVNAADVELRDIDVQVIYKYEDDYDFVGYHERSKVYFQDGHLSIQPDYEQKLQALVDTDQINHQAFIIDGKEIASTHSEGVLNVCLSQRNYTAEKIPIEGFLTDSISFNYEADLDVYVDRPNVPWHKFLYMDREFRMKGDLVIKGLYDQDFVDYQIRRLIASKLIYTSYDYLHDYHNVEDLVPPRQ